MPHFTDMREPEKLGTVNSKTNDGWREENVISIPEQKSNEQLMHSTHNPKE